MGAPLEGIKVVELASFVAAPAAGALLADMGAEVVKVEVPQGEIYRHSLPQLCGDRQRVLRGAALPDGQPRQAIPRHGPADAGRPRCAAQGHRSERHPAHEYAAAPPREVRPRRSDPARTRNPELIFASMSGYGPTGPDATTPAFDYTAYWARSGFMDQMREPDTPPTFQRPGIGDHAAALSMVSGSWRRCACATPAARARR